VRTTSTSSGGTPHGLVSPRALLSLVVVLAGGCTSDIEGGGAAGVADAAPPDGPAGEDCERCGDLCCSTCEGWVAEPLVVQTTRRVIPIYLRASDTAVDAGQKHVLALERALRGIQVWFGEHMGVAHDHATFALAPTIVISSDYSGAEWLDFGINGFLDPAGVRSDGCGMYFTALHELNEEGKLAAIGAAAIGDSVDLYFVLGGGGTLGSCGGPGIATTELETLIGAPVGTPGADPPNADLVTQCPTGQPDSCSTECAPVGVIAHEMGHGFGLPHSDERGDTACADATTHARVVALRRGGDPVPRGAGRPRRVGLLRASTRMTRPISPRSESTRGP
jgi:hypothetical protein